MIIKSFVSFLISFTFIIGVHAQNMNNETLGKFLTLVGDSVGGVLGYWQVAKGDLTMIVITDEANNSMRMISPIT